MRNPRSGFTMIELMIVVAIVLILAAIAYPMYTKHVSRSRQASASVALEAARLAMENAKARNGAYPAHGTNVEEIGGFDPSIWNGVDPGARYSLTIEESSATGFRIRATCAPEACNIDSDETADVWEIDSRGTLTNITNDVEN